LLRYLFISVLLLCLVSICQAGDLWHCTVTSKHHLVWNYFGKTKAKASNPIQKICKQYNDQKICPIFCFPPREYWRCVSHDTPPILKNKTNKKSKKQIKKLKQPKPGTWYWTSFSKQVAINGARDACRHNSPFGGCYVDPHACAES